MNYTIEPLDNQKVDYTERFDVCDEKYNKIGRCIFDQYFLKWRISFDNYKKEYPTREIAINNLIDLIEQEKER